MAGGEFGRHAAAVSGAARQESRYELHEFKERDLAQMAGVEQHQLFKIDKATGQVWKWTTEPMPIPTNRRSDPKVTSVWAEGWQPVADIAEQERWLAQWIASLPQTSAEPTPAALDASAYLGKK